MEWQSITGTRHWASAEWLQVRPGTVPKIEASRRPGSSRDPQKACIAVVDDDQEVRDGLESLLCACGYDVAPYAAPGDFLASVLCGRCDPACLILDVRIKTESGLDFQRALGLDGIDIPVVVITGHGDVAMTVRAMKQGAVDVLAKPAREEDVLDAVAAAVRLDTARRAERAEMSDLLDRYGTLSPRERQVMGLVIAGLMNKQIAGEIGLSEVTVKIHRSSVMRKMASDSLPDLVRMGERLMVRDPDIGRFHRRS
ncbi:response regulator transcription factor [Acuticoccus sediminis]|uniref:response regulator transcription factor n=1 Tax=Acuticoccus sediminis TaxID=2184697 RepID=UPI001CFCA9BE|nr:LuxR C-terminal-related transcriptional regulator [Acuticoccus sediminis]